MEEKKLEFEKEKFEFLKNRILMQDIASINLAEKSWHYEFIKLTIVLILILILVYYTFNYTKKPKNERFAPYASILVPDIINSTAGFDSPNQFGEITNPYQEEKNRSENKLFLQSRI